MSTDAKRRHFTAQEKVVILKRHLVEKTPVADLCHEFQLSPNVFYRWLKLFFERASLVFENNGTSTRNAQENTLRNLEAKLVQRNEVVAEITHDYLKLREQVRGH
jgi:transposase-like protein